ncbi:MAG: Hydroxyacylglutathione hydrolase [Turneriella sp.]|nr:Hydroxyacylglutathione hydrolase [Turneriella sp.]
MQDIVTVDCHYVQPKVAAAYLLRSGDTACFIDNNTNYAVPYLLEALKNCGYTPENVSHIIITHVHLDHAGGTGLLAQKCPNAVVVAHPRAAPHLIDPSRLVKSAQAVYGEENFKALYGDIVPVDEKRIVIPADGEVLNFGNRKLEFIYTRGHANHHFVINDKTSKSIFTGDSFGIAYPLLQHGKTPFLFPSTSPTDFDAHEARISYDKILNSGAEVAYPTHFGAWHDIPLGRKMLSAALDEIENTFNAIYKSTMDDKAANSFAREKIEKYFAHELNARGITLDANGKTILDMDIDLNSQGIAFAALRARKKAQA